MSAHQSFKMTPHRRAWLERLRDVGWSRRGLGSTGSFCMRAGWTEWVLEKGDDRRPSSAVGGDPSRRSASGWRYTDLEALTDAGRKALDP